MNKAKHITELSPDACEHVLTLMMQACGRIADDHGLVIDDFRWRGRSDGNAFETGFRVSVIGRAGEDRKREQELFAAAAQQIGLSASDFEREFSVEGHRFRLTGIDQRRPKYPISAERVSDGRLCKFPADEVVKLLRGEEGSVHAQR
ncbi:MAG: hypothetical protein U1E67_17205 [Hyphomicrobiales bacterium]